MSTFTTICILAGILVAAPSPEVEAIQKILAVRERAWSDRDMAALVADFAEDADMIDSNGTVSEGREAIHERYSALVKSETHSDAKFEQEVVQVRLHSAKIAVADGNWTVKNLKDATGKSIPDRNGHSTIVLAHNGKQWQIIALRSYLRSK